MTEAQVQPGYEQFPPAAAPPGMYFDPESGLFLPQGARLASRGRVAAAWFLGFSLFIVTLGIGYIAWSAFVWGQGRSPAQRILGLRCWQPELGRVAGRKQLALRQIPCRRSRSRSRRPARPRPGNAPERPVRPVPAAP